MICDCRLNDPTIGDLRLTIYDWDLPVQNSESKIQKAHGQKSAERGYPLRAVATPADCLLLSAYWFLLPPSVNRTPARNVKGKAGKPKASW
jgi:hypothetical protein